MLPSNNSMTKVTFRKNYCQSLSLFLTSQPHGVLHRPIDQVQNGIVPGDIVGLPVIESAHLDGKRAPYLLLTLSQLDSSFQAQYHP